MEKTDLLFKVARIFRYYKPDADMVPKFAELRNKAKELGAIAVNHCPEGEELSIALRKLQEFTMWANAAIARQGEPDVTQ